MPAAGAALVAAAFASASAWVAGGSVIIAGALAFGSSILQSAMAKKPKRAADFAAQSDGRTVQVRQAITTRKIIYGETRVSGPIAFVTSTGGNKYFHIVLPVASHEVEAIDEVWVNDQVVANDMLDASGNVIAGRYAGYMRIRKYLGTANQTADPFLVAEVPGWTEHHRGRGVAYVYVRMTYSRTAYPTGTPNISAVVRGRRLFDPRTGLSRYSMNAALMARDYICGSYGNGVPEMDVDDDVIIASANNCDEMVAVQERGYDIVSTAGNVHTLSGPILLLQRGDRGRFSTTGVFPSGLNGSTDYFVVPVQYGQNPRFLVAASLEDAMAGNAVDIGSGGSGVLSFRVNAEPRYHGSGDIDRGNPRGSNFRDILSAMGGSYCTPGGVWKVYSAMYREPEITFTDDDCRAPVTWDPWRAQVESFNSVKGIFVGPMNYWQASDYPEVSPPFYVAQDGGKKEYSETDLPMTPRHTTAQRIARIRIEQNRREINCVMPAKLRAILVEPCNTIFYNKPEFGFDNKVFEVISQQPVEEMSGNGVPVVGIDMVLQETDSNVYSWTKDYEKVPSPAPRTSMPNPFEVRGVFGLAIDSFPIVTALGDTTFRVVPRWTLHADVFVVEGGYFQVQYKKSDSATWIPVGGRIEGDETQVDAFSGSLGTLYDLRIRAFNRLGVPSPWQTVSGFVAGTTGGVGGTEDWRFFNETPTEFADWGSFSDTPATFEDWGTF